jgi:predicted small secreted protein
MKQALIILAIIGTALMLAGCAAGPNTMRKTPGDISEEADAIKYAGFWKGLWHGIITPVTFIVSLFNKNVNIYEVRNNGGWYNFGFMIGISIIFGGGSGGAARAGRRRD